MQLKKATSLILGVILALSLISCAPKSKNTSYESSGLNYSNAEDTVDASSEDSSSKASSSDGSSSNNSSSDGSSENTSSNNSSSDASPDDMSINEVVQLKPMTASDDGLLDSNPDRGFRTEFVFFVKKTQGSGERLKRAVYVDESEEQIRKDIQFVFDVYIYSKPLKPKLALSYLYITDWRGEDLSDDFFRFLDIYFTMCREQGIKNMLRFCYCDSHVDPSTGADQETILRHIKQLREPIKKYSDTIHTIEAGFVGAYGEWAEVYQRPPVDYETIIRAIVENLAVPNNLYFSLTSATNRNLVGKDYEHYWSISYNFDCMFGYQNNGWKPLHEPGTPGWVQVEKESAYGPQGGEMHTNESVINNNTVPNGFQMIKQCYVHHQTTLSSWHGYMEAFWTDNVMQRWMDNERITRHTLNVHEIIYDPNWFLDDEGQPVDRNPYEFIRDHLGYRLVVQEAKLSWSGDSKDKMKVDMSLINYGFSAAFNLESGFAILDSEGNVVSEVTAGEPNKWYNRDPDTPYTNEILTHNVSAELEAPTKKGEYKLAFFLRNTMGAYAKLCNKVENVNGYNILCSFDI